MVSRLVPSLKGEGKIKKMKCQEHVYFFPQLQSIENLPGVYIQVFQLSTNPGKCQFTIGALLGFG